jgi:VIT1/CCC1 family predicted Fe2+/Mn2+ transporter
MRLIPAYFTIMEQLPNRQTPQLSRPQTARVIRISVQPKTWFGKFIAGIIGVAVMLVAFFFSILAFAIVASIVVAAIIYFLWATRRARGAMRDQTIDGEVQSRDIQ